MNPAIDELGAEEIWKEPVDRILSRLATTAAGLDATEVQSRLKTFGPNDAAVVKRSPLWLQFLSRFRNPLVIILLVASGLSAATGDVASFLIVVTIVTISMTIDFVQEVRAQNAVEALRRSVAVQATVRRNGASVSIPIDQLVPGDIVELIAGDLVPADSRLLESRDLFINQALLTGEPYPPRSRLAMPRPAPKTPPERRTASSPAPPSSVAPQRLLFAEPAGRRLSATLRRAWPKSRRPPILRLAFAVWPADHAPYRVDGALRAGGEHLVSPARSGIADVRAGPCRRTDARAAADDRDRHACAVALELSKRKVIVKRLTAIHDLGAMNVLCTDKTGTLTEATIKLMRAIDGRASRARPYMRTPISIASSRPG